MARLFSSVAGDDIDCGASADFSFGTGEFSIVAWIKSTTAITQVSIGRFSGVGDDYWVGFSTGAATFSISGETATEPVATANDGNWHLLAGVRIGATARIYVDGTDRASVSSTNTANPGGSLVFGRFGDSGLVGFDGSIAEVAVYSVGLTAGEVASLADGACPLFVRPGAWVSYWRLIGRNSPEQDLVGGHNGVLTGTANDNHPRVFYTGSRQAIATKGGQVHRFNSAWARRANILIGGGVHV